MVMEEKQLVGICGIYCGTCPSFLAFRLNDTAMMAKLAEDYKMPMEALQCDGCLSNRVAPHCKSCRYGFRECAITHGVTWCFQCDEFPCKRLEKFQGVHVVDGISHHEHLIEFLAEMKAEGIEKWIRNQEVAGRCPACGTSQYWFARTCSVCGKQIRNNP